MSLMKKTRNDAIKAAVTSYLERRNYPVSVKLVQMRIIVCRLVVHY